MIAVNDYKIHIIKLEEIQEMGLKNVKKSVGNSSFWGGNKQNKVHNGIPNRRNVEKSKSIKPVTFQEVVRVILISGQIFSLIPVLGIWGKKASDVKFTWMSWKCVYSLFSLVGQCFITLMCIIMVVNKDSSLKGTTSTIFYGTTGITMFMFFNIGRRWPNLVQTVTKTEESDPNYDKYLINRCNITCAIVLTLSLLEHILSLLSEIAGFMVCESRVPDYEEFVSHFYPWVFNFIPYSVALGILTQFLHVQSTFIWNFSDLFVICMSYYLTSRLEHVNKKLLAAQGKYLPEAFWRSAREDYGRATQLVRKVDDVISGIVFISFANNLFFICYQLFNSLEDGIKGMGDCSVHEKGQTPLNGYEAATYFLFSLAYLICRSVGVSLIASQVNTASTVPAPVLYDVPSPVYCIEVQRFLEQVNGDKVALSGLQFFSVTRGLLLTVAGTIVTYELVMVQFTSSPSINTTITTMLFNYTSTSLPSTFSY